MQKNRTTSAIIYEGPSLIDGGPIVVVAIVSKRNRKTGDMLQTYIQRADVPPVEASRLGLDASQCGACPLRGIANIEKKTGQADKRACYVLLGQGPTGVYKTYRAGKYRHAVGHADIAALGAERMVRIGTYGDGAAVPAYIWDSLLSGASGHTAYSHQSGNCETSFDAARYMVSADSEQAARAAWSQGYRTFRVIASVNELASEEILCPASKEAGRRTQCARCKLCGGASVKAKSIAIGAHGAGARHFGA